MLAPRRPILPTKSTSCRESFSCQLLQDRPTLKILLMKSITDTPLSKYWARSWTCWQSLHEIAYLLPKKVWRTHWNLFSIYCCIILRFVGLYVETICAYTTWCGLGIRFWTPTRGYTRRPSDWWFLAFKAGRVRKTWTYLLRRTLIASSAYLLLSCELLQTYLLLLLLQLWPH